MARLNAKGLNYGGGGGGGVGLYRGFPTSMVYLHNISCLRYTILVGNPRIIYLYFSKFIYSFICLFFH